MSASAIPSSGFYTTQNIQSTFQQFQQEFQQLGQDLQSGNLSAAQSDFASLKNLGAQNSSATSQSNSPIAQSFKQLAKDLQSGNLSAAQQDFKTIQQDFPNQSAPGQTQAPQSHYHHHSGGSSEVTQLLDQLGTALQAGDLSSAQQAYTSLTQQFQQSSQSSGVQPGSTSVSGLNSVATGVSGGVSINA
jgi:outer membrane protein assembly factor BamD (BamD/ComL family)